MVDWWYLIILGVIGIVIGFIIGFFVIRHLFKRSMEKNPPINEQMIRAMMTQMGRTPSEKQVRAVMKSMEDAKNK
jgi:uncharacterized protein YneF (UPF0154 family)